MRDGWGCRLLAGLGTFVLSVAGLSLVVYAPPLTNLTSLSRPGVKIPATYFGFHIHRATSSTPWPKIPVHAWRLWDTQTTWADVAPSRGAWQFEQLDRIVLLGQQHKVELLLCLGQTPAWAALNQDVPAGRNWSGLPSPPRSMQDWRDYVRVVALRYKGRIRAYEIWNEPNLPDYYTGNVSTMVAMTKDASAIIHEVDRNAMVVGPSPTGLKGVRWLKEYLSAGGGQYVDVIGFHFYVTPDDPEQMLPLIDNVKSEMAAHGISKLPLWNTETGWSNPKQFPDPREADAFLDRALMLAWVAGVSRFYWYAWDNNGWVTLQTTDGTTHEANQTGETFGRVQQWLIGSSVDWCAEEGSGDWRCRVNTADGPGEVFWNPHQEHYVVIPRQVSTRDCEVIDVSGHKSACSEKIKVGMSPIVIRSSGIESRVPGD